MKDKRLKKRLRAQDTAVDDTRAMLSGIEADVETLKMGYGMLEERLDALEEAVGRIDHRQVPEEMRTKNCGAETTD